MKQAHKKITFYSSPADMELTQLQSNLDLPINDRFRNAIDLIKKVYATEIANMRTSKRINIIVSK